MPKKVKISALHDRVIILRDKADEVSKGGIVIPDTNKEKPGRGVIVAIGPGSAEKPTQAKVGDKVLFSKYSGQEIEYEDVDYLVMREDEILMVI